MDSKTNHNSMKTDESVPVGVQTSEVKEESSRFSRRRFLRSAAVASPILLSVKSPTAWAADTLPREQCSITVYLSGNPSNPQNLGCDARNTAYWINTFTGGNKIVEEELARRGITASTPFFQLFPLTAFQSWRAGDTSLEGNTTWYYRINPYSDNPTVLQALQNADFDLSLDFDKNIDNSSGSDSVNLVDSVPNFHTVMITAYLNSLFHPTPVSYLGDAQYVADRFAVTMQDSADACLAGISSSGSTARMLFKYGSVSYSDPLKELSDALNTWDISEL